MVTFSFLMPTRERPDLVDKFFKSIKENTSNLHELEIIMAIDSDDEISKVIQDRDLNLKKIIVSPGMTMGEYNRACFDASSGRFVMLVNDDLLIHTRGWDERIRAAIGKISDDIALIHVNDLLFKKRLCCFPFVSREACLITDNNICPPDFIRYRIDDYIYDIYNMLAYLGHKRIFYMDDVIFEHTNHKPSENEEDAENVFNEGDKVYIANQQTMQMDSSIFDDKLEDRKRHAINLAMSIDKSRGNFEKYVDVLCNVTDNSFSYRQSDFVIEYKQKCNVSIGIVSPNIKSGITQKCIDNVKKYSPCAQVFVLDNAGNEEFKHAVEMNRLIKMCNTKYLVLLDDDAFVSQGWLEGLLEAFNDEVGVVCPIHYDAENKYSYSGVYLDGNGTGEHYHNHDQIVCPRESQTLCSAAMAIDLHKCGNIYFDENCKKYFHDIIYGLRVWENGYKVIITPHSKVTHIGGGTIMQGGKLGLVFWNADKEYFRQSWVATGRLKALENNILLKQPYVAEITILTRRINTLLLNYDSFSDKEKISKLLSNINEANRLKAFAFFDKLMSLLFELFPKNNFHKKIKCMELLLDEFEGLEFLTPKLICCYKEYNIVAFKMIIFGVPLSKGIFDLSENGNLKDKDLISATKIQDVFREIDKKAGGWNFFKKLKKSFYANCSPKDSNEDLESLLLLSE